MKKHVSIVPKMLPLCCGREILSVLRRPSEREYRKIRSYIEVRDRCR